MKKILVAAALLFAVPAQAQVIDEEVCVTLGDMGGKIMEIRQAGASKLRVLSIITTTDSTAYDLIVATVDFAYAMPLNTSPAIIDELVTNKCLEVVYNDRYPANT